MNRPLDKRAVRRRRALGRTALVVTLAVTAGIGATTGTATAADPATASAEPVVISPGARFVPRATLVLNTGETGFLTAREGDDRLRWIDYATGTTTVLDHRLPKPLAYDVDDFRFDRYPGEFGHGSDTVALYAASPSPHVTLQQRAGDGSTVTVARWVTRLTFASRTPSTARSALSTRRTHAAHVMPITPSSMVLSLAGTS